MKAMIKADKSMAESWLSSNIRLTPFAIDTATFNTFFPGKNLSSIFPYR
jgi:hypothetical protein